MQTEAQRSMRDRMLAMIHDGATASTEYDVALVQAARVEIAGAGVEWAMTNNPDALDDLRDAVSKLQAHIEELYSDAN